MSHPVTRGASAVIGLLFAGNACAQLSGSATLVSDYRFRGVSFSDEQPAAQFGVAYDHAGGGYAGVFGSTTQLAGQEGRNLQLFSYLGYMWRASSGLNWEAGAGYSAFAGYHDYDYPEIYWGVATDNISGRFYYAPNYFGERSRTLYAELNGARPLPGQFRLLAHIGVLYSNHAGSASDASARYRYDLRAGIGVDMAGVSIELTAVTTDSGSAVYPVSDDQKRHAIVLSLSRSF